MKCAIRIERSPDLNGLIVFACDICVLAAMVVDVRRAFDYT
ncbi:MAG: hypothetical protein WD382_09460 [Halofilum sp. (in: g-proteobacteria)]